MSDIIYTKLSEVIMSPISGKRPPGGVNTKTDGVPSLGGENILSFGGVVYDVIKKIPFSFYKSMLKGKLLNLDVLINKDGAQTGKVGLYKAKFQEAAINEHLFILRPIDNSVMNPSYLYYSLLLPETQIKIERRITGSAQPGLNSTFVKSVDVPFYKIKKQIKIKNILENIDQTIEKTETLIHKYQQIKAGLMQDLFTRGVTADGKLRPPREQAPELYKESPVGWIPRGWDYGLLNEIVNPSRPIVYGILMPGYGFDGGIPVVKVKDISDRKIKVDNLLLTSPNIDNEYRRSKLKAGDILLTIRGTVGRVCIVPEELDGANITQDTARIDLSGGNNNFYSYYFETDGAIRHFSINTLGVAVQGINLGEVRKTPIPKPSKKEQFEIVKRISNINSKIDREKENNKKLKFIKFGLMHDLLTGKVQVKVEKKEPAHV